MDYSGKIITKNPVEPSQTSAPGVWTLDQATQAVQGNNWPIAYVPNPISRSLRFNPADTAYLSRTFGTPTNNKKWTMSGWMKRSAINDGNYNTLFSRYVDGNNFMRVDLLGDNFRMYQYQSGTDVLLRSTLVLRDPSAWYHFVVVYDSDNATSSNRVLFYINNTQITSFSSSTYPSSGTSSIWNTSGGATHQIGTFNANGVGEAFSGYLTEINFIDGQALDSTYFGMTDPRTGAWIPKKYSGTYGTNGFYLNFSDNSSTAALGTDYSGNSNTWTTNNFSVTAGSGNDSMVDVPTLWIPYNTTGDVGGVVRGNYATLNPISTLSAGATISDGNLQVVTVASGDNAYPATIGMSSGKFYSEVVWTAGTGNSMIGILPVSYATGTGIGYNANSVAYDKGGNLRNAGSVTSSWGATWAIGDVMAMAFDADAGTLDFYKNNVKQGSTVTGFTSGPYFFAVGEDSGSVSSTLVCNFGQRPFAYTPPAGFKSLCTTNLPEPTVLDGGDYMNAVLWTGNSSASQAVTGVGFQPDLVWAKSRPANSGQDWVDAVRGATQNLQSSSTAAETTSNTVISFQSDGFTVGDGLGYDINKSGESVVGWCWKAAGSTVSNTAGTITSTVSANQTAGFSIVTYTSTTGTVGHGLGVAPAMIIMKGRNVTDQWTVGHRSLNGGVNAWNYGLPLNDTASTQTNSGFWNNTAPTSTVFSQGSWDSGYTKVAYCFAPVAGFSAFGSYTGNASTDGPFVYTGFRPRWIMMKYTNTTSYWLVMDTTRSPYNVTTLGIQANSTAAENSGLFAIDILSNGFKPRDGGGLNGSGNTTIYAAFAENPFKYSNAR